MGIEELRGLDRGLDVENQIIEEVRGFVNMVFEGSINDDQKVAVVNRLNELRLLAASSFVRDRIITLIGTIDPSLNGPCKMGYEELENEVKGSAIGNAVISNKYRLKMPDAPDNQSYAWRRYIIALFLAKAAIENPSQTLVSKDSIQAKLNISGGLIGKNWPIIRSVLSGNGFYFVRTEIENRVYFGFRIFEEKKSPASHITT